MVKKIASQPIASFNTTDNQAEISTLSAPHRKWGIALNAGFQLLPDLVLKHQRRLGLGANDLVVLINLMMSWWYPERLPYPRPTTIAKRMGVGVRSVQRSLERLQQMGLIERVALPPSADMPTTAAYDLSGLVSRLQKLAIDNPGYRDRLPAAPELLEEFH